MENGQYRFRVISVNEIGEGSPSEETEIVTCKDPFDVPSPPEDLEAQHLTKDSITVAWNKPNYYGDKPISGYIVEYR